MGSVVWFELISLMDFSCKTIISLPWAHDFRVSFLPSVYVNRCASVPVKKLLFLPFCYGSAIVRLPGLVSILGVDYFFYIFQPFCYGSAIIRLPGLVLFLGLRDYFL